MGPVEPLDHETKYVLPERAARSAAALLAGVCRRDDEHAESVVESIYFDTPELASWGEKRASDYRKTKIRLRWYDGGGPVWLELKRRVGSRREKRRLPVALDGALLSRRGLAAPELAVPTLLLAALGEPLPAALAPVAHLRYRRSRYLAHPDGARLALDRAIEWLALDARRCRVSPPAARTGALPHAVVELKGASRDLPAILAGLAALGARRGSFSKYGACLAAGFGEA